MAIRAECSDRASHLAPQLAPVQIAGKPINRLIARSTPLRSPLAAMSFKAAMAARFCSEPATLAIVPAANRSRAS
jgi:hypothetical protein